MSSDVTFRRVRGRIIPIRIKNKGELAQGAGLVATGVTASLAASEAAAQVVKKAATMRKAASASFKVNNLIYKSLSDGGQLAFNFSKELKKAKAARTAAIGLRKLSFTVRHLRTPLLGAGVAGAGFLLGKGIERIVESQRNKQLGLAGEGIADAAGAGLALGALAFYYKRIGAGSVATAFKYAKAAGTGTKLPHIPIQTKFGFLKFGK